MMRISRLMVYVVAAMVTCLAAVPLAVRSASAASSAGTGRLVGSVGSAVHPSDDDSALRKALRAVVDAGATGAIGLVDDGADVSAVAVGGARLDLGDRAAAMVG